jgi:uncharacterized protein YcfL
MNKFVLLSAFSIFLLTACSQHSIKSKEPTTSIISEQEVDSENTISTAYPVQCVDKDSCVVAVSCEDYPDAEVCYSAPSHREGPSGEPYTKVE